MLRSAAWAFLSLITGCVVSKDTATDHAAEQDCLDAGGRWEDWGDVGQEACNLPTSDAGRPCSDSQECESYCEAPQGTEPGAAVEGACYGWMHASCMQEVRDGVADAEWCH